MAIAISEMLSKTYKGKSLPRFFRKDFCLFDRTGVKDCCQHAIVAVRC